MLLSKTSLRLVSYPLGTWCIEEFRLLVLSGLRNCLKYHAD